MNNTIKKMMIVVGTLFAGFVAGYDTHVRYCRKLITKFITDSVPFDSVEDGKTWGDIIAAIREGFKTTKDKYWKQCHMTPTQISKLLVLRTAQEANAYYESRQNLKDYIVIPVVGVKYGMAYAPTFDDGEYVGIKFLYDEAAVLRACLPDVGLSFGGNKITTVRVDNAHVADEVVELYKNLDDDKVIFVCNQEFGRGLKLEKEDGALINPVKNPSVSLFGGKHVTCGFTSQSIANLINDDKEYVEGVIDEVVECLKADGHTAERYDDCSISVAEDRNELLEQAAYYVLWNLKSSYLGVHDQEITDLLALDGDETDQFLWDVVDKCEEILEKTGPWHDGLDGYNVVKNGDFFELA